MYRNDFEERGTCYPHQVFSVSLMERSDRIPCYQSMDFGQLHLESSKSDEQHETATFRVLNGQSLIVQVIYQTRKTVFDHISKLREES